MRKSPCKNCDRRQLGCHEHCLNYLDYREELEYIRKKEREETNKYIKHYDNRYQATKQYKTSRGWINT